MSKYRVLTIRDSSEWNELLNSCGQSDIHFTPKYMQLFEENGYGEALLFVDYNSDESNYVLYPFFKRRINDLEIFSSYDKIVFDIISPWYFGGPLLHNYVNSRDLLEQFIKNFGKYVNENNIITEFTRIHPLLFSSEDFVKQSQAQYKYDISYINLQASQEDIWKNFKKSNKNAINAAIRRGIKIQISNSIDAMKIFYDLYIKSMNRLNANKSYFLPFSFFEKLLKYLSDNLIIFTAAKENTPISSSIFLFKSGIIHYWLSGSDFEYRNFYPNNLLLFESIKWAKNNECKSFVLMGGTSEGLRSFKESFSNDSIGFYTLQKIYDNNAYSILNEIRKKHNMEESEDFFPLYRI